MLFAIALGNKMARALWAVVSKIEDYRELGETATVSARRQPRGCGSQGPAWPYDRTDQDLRKRRIRNDIEVRDDDLDVIGRSQYPHAASGNAATKRPHKRPRSITWSTSQKIFASRAATIEADTTAQAAALVPITVLNCYIPLGIPVTDVVA